MNLITRKLRSQSGASMLIALVFMMFCLFVGGSVLAAASANGYRVKHLGLQQATLDQRSAAWLISDELQALDDSGNEISHVLEVADTKFEVQKVQISGGGVPIPIDENPVIYREVIFKAPTGLKMTPFQRLMYETAVWRYLNENSVSLTDSKTRIKIEDFTYQNGTEDGELISTIQKFWYTTETFGGEVAISCKTKDNTPIADYTAKFLCEDTTGKLYDFVVTFGENTTLSVVMNGGIWKDTSFDSDSAAKVLKEWTWGTETYDAYVRELPNYYNIEWDDPEIRKGGN